MGEDATPELDSGITAFRLNRRLARYEVALADDALNSRIAEFRINRRMALGSFVGGRPAS